MKKNIKLLLLITWMFIIFCFSAQDSNKSKNTSNQVIIKTVEFIKQEQLSEPEKENIIEKFILPVRKSAHFFSYFILGILITLLLKDYYNITITTFIYALIFCFIYACTDEIHQLFVPGRAGQFLDVIIDTSGAFISTSIYQILHKMIKKHI